MNTHITLVTPEYVRAELEARYSSASRSRRERPDSSLNIEARSRRRRLLEGIRSQQDPKAS